MPLKTSYSIEELTRYFNHRITQFGPTIEGLQWQSRDSQETRYNVIKHHLPNQKSSLLDVGCGCGDFFHYLKKHQLPFHYTGIDVSANMIISAQESYPSGIFKCLSLEEISINHSFDYVVASGTFNIRMYDYQNYLINQLKIMINITKKLMIINFLSHKVAHRSQSKQFIYHNPPI